MKVIRDTFLTIHLQTDLCSSLDEPLQLFRRLTRADYFEHLLVKNYYGRDFTVSSFCNNNEWQDFYWKEFWFNDSLERKMHKNILLNKSAMIPWSMVDETDECMIKRKDICSVVDGVSFGRLISPQIMECFSVGWENKDDKKRMLNSIHNENNHLKEISDAHLHAFKNLQ